MGRGKIVIISGPSGSGKTTLYKKLLASKKVKGNLVKSISVTSRPMRKGEKEGRDYFFVSLKMFLHKKRKRHFLESEKVFDNYYGTPYKNVRELLGAGKNVLLCIDVKGTKTVCQKISNVVTIFVKAPSIQTLKFRLNKRGSENGDVVRLRLAAARKEMREAIHYRHTIINDNLRTAYRQLEAIVCAELNRDPPIKQKRIKEQQKGG